MPPVLTSLNITVTRLTQEGMSVKSCDVPEVVAIAVRKVKSWGILLAPTPFTFDGAVAQAPAVACVEKT